MQTCTHTHTHIHTYIQIACEHASKCNKRRSALYVFYINSCAFINVQLSDSMCVCVCACVLFMPRRALGNARLLGTNHLSFHIPINLISCISHNRIYTSPHIYIYIYVCVVVRAVLPTLRH